jgi:hypothetical protein
MKHKREFDTIYFHNPIVQGVNYSLFIMLLKEMVSMESKGQPRAAPSVYPLLSSQSTDPFGVFRVSPLSHHKIYRRVLYIVGFRSSQIHGDQVCIERMHEARDGSHHAARVWPTWWPSFAPCRVPDNPSARNHCSKIR